MYEHSRIQEITASQKTVSEIVRAQGMRRRIFHIEYRVVEEDRKSYIEYKVLENERKFYIEYKVVEKEQTK